MKLTYLFQLEIDVPSNDPVSKPGGQHTSPGWALNNVYVGPQPCYKLSWGETSLVLVWSWTEWGKSGTC